MLIFVEPLPITLDSGYFDGALMPSFGDGTDASNAWWHAMASESWVQTGNSGASPGRPRRCKSRGQSESIVTIRLS